MADKLVELDGKQYSVPADASMDEIDSYIQTQGAKKPPAPDLKETIKSDVANRINRMNTEGFMGSSLSTNAPQSMSLTKTAGPVLREQPSAMEEATQPGGIASAENMGIIGGGMTGARLGASLGPAGAVLGGLAGAGLGAGGGRGWEMLLEKLYGPYRTAGTEPLQKTERTPGEVVGEIGEASQRGIMAEGIGALGGKVLGTVGSKILGPSAAKMTPEAIRAAEVAKEHGIDITAGETTGSGLASRLEGIASKGITGASRAKEFAERRQGQIASAVGSYAEKLSPDAPKELSGVGQVIQAHAEGRLNGLAKASQTLAKQVSGGPVMGATQVGETVQQAKERLFESLKGEADTLYEKVKTLAGDQAKSIASPSFREIANEIVSKESKLTGVKLPSARVARGAMQSMTQDQLIGGVDPASLPASLIQKFGLDKEKMWDLDTLRQWQSRLGQLYATSKNRLARRDFAKMFGAVSDDIKAWGNQANPEINTALKNANEFYKTRIADTYFNRVVSGIDTAEPDVVSRLFIKPQGSTVMMDRVKTAIGPEAWKKAAGQYLSDLMDQSEVNGRFSPMKVLQELDKHDPEVLKRLFGPQLTAEKGLVKMIQQNPNKMIAAILNKPEDKVVEFLVPRGGSTENLQNLRMLLPTKEYDKMAGAMMNNIVRRSYNNRGVFSLDLFLTQVNSRTGYTQAQQRALLGDQYGSFRELVDVVSRMRRGQAFSENPSGSGLTGIGFGQIAGGGILLARVGKDIWEGKEDPGTMFEHVGEGLALASPALIGKIVYSKGGIKWLTEGLKAPPGSAQAANAIAKVTAILANPKLGISPEKEVRSPYSSITKETNTPEAINAKGQESPTSESSTAKAETQKIVAPKPTVSSIIQNLKAKQRGETKDEIAKRAKNAKSIDDLLQSGEVDAKDLKQGLAQ